jgi:peptide/nickel transport system permease protein
MATLASGPDDQVIGFEEIRPQAEDGEATRISSGTFKRIVRTPSIVLSAAFLGIACVVAIIGPYIAPYDPNAVNASAEFASPSWTHWLGTDQLGRDLLSRLIVGTRVSIEVSVVVVAIALVIGLPVGLVSGYKSGRFDNVVMRFVDAGLSIPGLVLALAVAGLMGPGVRSVVIALTIVAVPGFIRVVRGATLSAREETYVEASRTIGTPPWWIMIRRMAPNIRSPLLVYSPFAAAQALLAEAGLSYLGYSEPPPAATWGNMLRTAYDFALFTKPWQLVIPGVPIALTVLAFNGLGDGLRDVFGVARPRRIHRHERRGLTSVALPSPTGTRHEAASEVLLDVRGLSVEFSTVTGDHRVVNDVSLTINRGETLGLVGESGSGKSVTSLAISRLLPSPPARIVSGEVWFDGTDVMSLTHSEIREVRGNGIGMIFQDPMTSLDPAFTVGNQLVEAQRLSRDLSRGAARAGALELLAMVRVPAAAERLASYPHELSGGMRQRVMIAMALAGRPQLLIADEPTTSLDVTIQAQILDLLRDLQRELGMAVLFVTHDLGVVADLCDRVSVMYAGQIVEEADVDDLFTRPGHPYAEGLLGAMPQIGQRHERLMSIPGQVPLPSAMPTGCRFEPRCPYATDQCHSAVPLITVGVGHESRCVRSGELDLCGSE